MSEVGFDMNRAGSRFASGVEVLDGLGDDAGCTDWIEDLVVELGPGNAGQEDTLWEVMNAKMGES